MLPTDNNAITLNQLLESRDERAAFQREIITALSCTLISFTVVMPGSVKLNKESKTVFAAGKKAIKLALAPYPLLRVWESLKLTGPEGFYAVNSDPIVIKREMIRLEETHPLGRLFDIDVIGSDFAPISRTETGESARKCLICGNDAALCVRQRAHSTEQILEKIRSIIADG